jgi:hypothetical protein
MMMAHDSNPGPVALEAETIKAVRDALAQYVDAPSQPTTLRGALERIALEARAKAMLPEQLLVVLKDIWYSLPSVQAIADPNEQVRLLQRVVTMCIKAYYAD